MVGTLTFLSIGKRLAQHFRPLSAEVAPPGPGIIIQTDWLCDEGPKVCEINNGPFASQHMAAKVR